MSSPFANVDPPDGVVGQRPMPLDGLPIPTFIPTSSSGLPLSMVPRILAGIECSVVFLAALLTKVVYLDNMVGTVVPWQTYIMIATCMVVAMYLFYLHMGLYETDALLGPQIGFGKLVGGIALALLTVLGLLYALKEIGQLSRGWIFIWFALSCVLIVCIRVMASRRVKNGTARGHIIQRIAIVGCTGVALKLASNVRQSEGLSGAIDLYHCGDEPRDYRFVGGVDTLESVMADRPYDRVLVAIPNSEGDLIRSTVRALGAYTTELLLCTELRGMPVATNGTRQFGGMRADVIHLVPLSERSGMIKRAVDIVLAAAGLVVLSPVFLLIALAIKLDSRGPVIFFQRRHGKGSSIFWIFKFRSMFVEEGGAIIRQATVDDERVTRVGWFLRSTSFDELPQLINVFLGDMSLVGPRPHAIAHDTAFERNFDLFSRRRRVKPGITGWAQVNGFRGETKNNEDVRGRIERDLYYIDNWSIWLDMEIMTRTVFVMARGAH